MTDPINAGDFTWDLHIPQVPGSQSLAASDFNVKVTTATVPGRTVPDEHGRWPRSIIVDPSEWADDARLTPEMNEAWLAHQRDIPLYTPPSEVLKAWYNYCSGQGKVDPKSYKTDISLVSKCNYKVPSKLRGRKGTRKGWKRKNKPRIDRVELKGCYLESMGDFVPTPNDARGKGTIDFTLRPDPER